MKSFSGNVLFLDRNDINTDEIIPAKYLTEVDKMALKPHLLEDLILEGFSPESSLPGIDVIITRNNFGCGSSREHAPWALEVNGINLVIAQGFARIFQQNMFNCGMMAVVLDNDTIDMLFKKHSSSPCTITTDFENKTLTIKGAAGEDQIPFDIGPFQEDLVKAGGWLEYADTKY